MVLRSVLKCRNVHQLDAGLEFVADFAHALMYNTQVEIATNSYCATIQECGNYGC